MYVPVDIFLVGQDGPRRWPNHKSLQLGQYAPPIRLLQDLGAALDCPACGETP